MENQINMSDQNPVNQQPISPKKSKINYWMISTILLAVILVLGVFYTYKITSNQSLRIEQLLNTSIPTTSQIVQPNQNLGSLIWSKIGLTEPNTYFAMNVDSLMNKPEEDLYCLEYENIEDTLTIISSDLSSVDDSSLSGFSNEIVNHRFSDEQIIYSDTGQKGILNEGKKSIRTITYHSVCKSNGRYFFILDTSFPPEETGFFEGLKHSLGLGNFSVNAAGGMSYPSHFAYSDKNGDLIILENFPSSESHITLPALKSNQDRTEEYSGLTTTSSIAYYGCGRIYAANDSEVLVGCGGGDGPAGGSGVFLVNLASQNTKEKAFCLSNPKYSKRCFDDKGKVYKEELNQK